MADLRLSTKEAPAHDQSRLSIWPFAFLIVVALTCTGAAGLATAAAAMAGRWAGCWVGLAAGAGALAWAALAAIAAACSALPAAWFGTTAAATMLSNRLPPWTCFWGAGAGLDARAACALACSEASFAAVADDFGIAAAAITLPPKMPPPFDLGSPIPETIDAVLPVTFFGKAREIAGAPFAGRLETACWMEPPAGATSESRP